MSLSEGYERYIRSIIIIFILLFLFFVSGTLSDVDSAGDLQEGPPRITYLHLLRSGVLLLHQSFSVPLHGLISKQSGFYIEAVVAPAGY